MKLYVYWAIMGFLFMTANLIMPRTPFLIFSGCAFFTAVIAFKFSSDFLIQICIYLILAPLFYMAAKPEFKKEKKNAK